MIRFSISVVNFTESLQLNQGKISPAFLIPDPSLDLCIYTLNLTSVILYYLLVYLVRVPSIIQRVRVLFLDNREKDFYQKIRIQIRNWIESNQGKQTRWTEYILLAPDLFHLLCKLMIDPDVPSTKKLKVGATIAYFISPIDFLPEGLLGPIGYLDDIALTAYILNDIVNEVDPQIITRNWAGETEILLLIKTILINSDKMLGSGLWKKIRKKFL